MEEAPFTPNLFILGMPKSGTSSLHEWLSAHPDIGEGSHKEVRFLLDAEEPLARPDGYAKTGLEGYGHYFPAHTKTRKAYWIDSSPTYYYQRCALDVLGSMSDRIFAGLLYRRPGARIHSFYQYAMHNRTDIPRDWDFEAFLKAVAEGPEGRLRAKPGLANLFRHSDYVGYTRKWLERIPRERFFFFTFEQVTKQPLDVVRELCGQFGLDPTFYDTYDFPRENRSYFVKNPAFHELIRHTAQRLPMPPTLKHALRRLYERVNTKELVRERDDRTAELIADLDRRYEPGLAELEDMTGLDLSSWRT